MDPTLGEKQNNQPQQKRPKGEYAVNAINNLVRTRNLFKNPLGKFGLRFAAQARTMASFLATNPWVYVILVILIVVVFTFVIVMGFGGAPTSEQGKQVANPTPIETITPTIAPTEIPIATPAEP